MQSGTPSKSAKGNFFMQFWQGGAQLRRSPLQHLPVRFTCSKLRLVEEVSPFDSKFTARGSLTQMQSGTPSKLAEGNFFMQFWQGGAQLRQSALQHLPVRFAYSKLRLVEMFPFDSEFTARGSLTWMWSGTPSKLAKGDFFRGVIVHFLKNTCLRTMECLHCELKAFSECAYIYMHKAAKGLSNKSFDNFLLCAKTFRKFLHLSNKSFDNFLLCTKTFRKFLHLTL